MGFYIFTIMHLMDMVTQDSEISSWGSCYTFCNRVMKGKVRERTVVGEGSLLEDPDGFPCIMWITAHGNGTSFAELGC